MLNLNSFGSSALPTNWCKKEEKEKKTYVGRCKEANKIPGVDLIAEDVRGAVTCSEDVCITHNLFADDLTLLSNEAGALQNMLCRLNVCARKKHLIINTAKSEVVHFNAKGSTFPVFTIGNDTLAHKVSFKHLGMIFHRTFKLSLNMAKWAENAPRAILTSVREHTLADRLHASLWLAKTCLLFQLVPRA
eukprot:1157492-Pelagomonas_calceolata.AAC.2